jgi:signal transduction histidine kinase
MAIYFSNRTFIWRLALVLVLPLLFFLVLLAFYDVVKVTQYDYIANQYDEGRYVEACEYQLPCSDVILGKDYTNNEYISLQIPFDRIAYNQPIFLYIPFYRGDLTVEWRGNNLYQDPSKPKFIPISDNRSLLLAIPNDWRDDRDQLTISVRKSVGPFLQLSNVYLGKKEYFEGIYDLRNTLTFGIREWLWMTQIFSLISFLALFIFNKFDRDLVPLLIIFLVIFGLLAPKTILTFDVSWLSIFVFKCNPIFLVAIWDFYGTQNDNKHSKGSSRLWFAAIILTICMLALDLHLTEYPMLVEFLLATPIFIFGLMSNVLYGLFVFVKRGAIGNLFLAFGVFSLMFAIPHDVLSRSGVLDRGLSTTPLATTFLFFTLAILFGNKVLSTRRALQEQKDALLHELKVRETQLFQLHSAEVVNAKTIAAQNEKRKITRDLHDGVLTYLSMISVFSGSSKENLDTQVQHLAENASREIRLILDGVADDDQTVMLMLGSLHEQIIQPLIRTGIEVEWDVLAFLDIEVLPSYHVLNLFRIMQELLHNAVFRSNCSKIVVRAGFDDAKFPFITISNFGGMPFHIDDKMGNGIKNVERRASLIDVMFDITPNISGADVTLRFQALALSSLRACGAV